MQLNAVLLAALAGIALAAPAADKCPKLPTPAQAKRIKVQESIGLGCSVGPQCIYNCGDSHGGGCYINIWGGGDCVF